MDASIFQGLVTMLPLVQHFPEDNLISIDTTTGVSSIVVWAHHILGLSVLLNIHNNDGLDSHFRFGEQSEQVIIHFSRPAIKLADVRVGDIFSSSSITLLSADKQEIRLHIKSDKDDAPLDSAKRSPARGYLKGRLKVLSCDVAGRERLLTEISPLACAYAICVSNALRVSNPYIRGDGPNHGGLPHSETSETEESRSSLGDLVEQLAPDEDFNGIKFEIPAKVILASTRMLFDDEKIRFKEVEDYVDLLAGTALHTMEHPPRKIATIVESWCHPDTWNTLRFFFESMAELILSFANVVDMDACSELPLYMEGAVSCFQIQALAPTSLHKQLVKWDGRSVIHVTYCEWMHAITNLLLGRDDALDFSSVSLVSDRGWSAFLGTFCKDDPFNVGKSLLGQVRCS